TITGSSDVTRKRTHALLPHNKITESTATGSRSYVHAITKMPNHPSATFNLRRNNEKSKSNNSTWAVKPTTMMMLTLYQLTVPLIGMIMLLMREYSKMTTMLKMISSINSAT